MLLKKGGTSNQSTTLLAISNFLKLIINHQIVHEAKEHCEEIGETYDSDYLSLTNRLSNVFSRMIGPLDVEIINIQTSSTLQEILRGKKEALKTFFDNGIDYGEMKLEIRDCLCKKFQNLETNKLDLDITTEMADEVIKDMKKSSLLQNMLEKDFLAIVTETMIVTIVDLISHLFKPPPEK